MERSRFVPSLACLRTLRRALDLSSAQVSGLACRRSMHAAALAQDCVANSRHSLQDRHDVADLSVWLRRARLQGTERLADVGRHGQDCATRAEDKAHTRAHDEDNRAGPALPEIMLERQRDLRTALAHLERHDHAALQSMLGQMDSVPRHAIAAALLRILCADRPPLCTAFLKLAQEVDIQWTVDDRHLILTHRLAAGDLELARNELMTAMSVGQVSAGMFTESIRASNLRGRHEEACRLVELSESLGRLTLSQLTIAMRGLRASDAYMQVLLDKVSTARLDDELSHWRGAELLLTLLQSGYIEQACLLWHSLPTRSFTYRRRLQEAMLRKASQHSYGASEFEEMLRFFRQSGSRADTIMYSAAAWQLYKDHRYRDAVELLVGALRRGAIVLDLVVCVIIVEALAKCRNLVGVVSCLREMRANKIALDRQAHNRIRRIIDTLEDGASPEDVARAREQAALLWRKRHVMKAQRDAAARS